MVEVTQLVIGHPCRLCLVLFLSGCFVYAIPGMSFASLCLFLPCLICATLVTPHEKPRGATPESINELPTYKFKSKENGRGEGGVWAAGTIKERTLSEEDAVSSMISFMALQLVAKPTSGHGTESGLNAAINLKHSFKK